jgi:Ca2+-binding RTX toxin-like protein
MANRTGTRGDDTLTGTSAADTLSGLDGNDLLDGLAGHDSLSGGGDEDVLFGRAGSDTLDGGLGSDNLFGGDGADVLRGGAGEDFLIGDAGDDRLDGGIGRDVLVGGLGSDTFVVAGAEAEYDAFNGGDGYDEVVLRAAGDVTLSAFGGYPIYPVYVGVAEADGGMPYPYPYAATGIDAWNGRYGEDSYGIVGNAGDNLLDFTTTRLIDVSFVDGRGGNDTLYGGDASDDLLRGGDGSDRLEGNAGSDTLDGGAGADVLNGGLGDDVLVVSADLGELDQLDGGDGWDKVVMGGAGDVTLDAFGRPKDIWVRPMDDAAIAPIVIWPPIDTWNHIEEWDGGYGGQASAILGNAGANRLDFSHTLLRNVTHIDGGDGDDVIIGAEASGDRLFGAADDDWVYGRAGNDSLDGGDGRDGLYGEYGDDLLLGGAGGDALDGGSGDDTFVGGAGADWHYGGLGNDVFQVAGMEAEFDDFQGGDGRDAVVLGAAGDVTLDNFSHDVYLNWRGRELSDWTFNGVERWDGRFAGVDYGIRGNAGDNGLNFADTELVNVPFVDGAAGDDTIVGSTLSGDWLRGGAGDDQLRGGGGADTITGGTGDDVLRGGADADVFVFRGLRDAVVEEDWLRDYRAAAGDRLDLPGGSGSVAALAFDEGLQHWTITLKGDGDLIHLAGFGDPDSAPALLFL